MSIDTLKLIGDLEVSERKSYLEREFVTRLELLGTDYFDVFHITIVRL